MTVLVIAEHDHASLKPVTLNTVTAAAPIIACSGSCQRASKVSAGSPATAIQPGVCSIRW